MHFSLITLFPEYFSGPLNAGLLLKGQDAGLVSFSFHNPRDTTTDPHHTVDDRPYGGGPGMVMLPQPLATIIEALGYAPAFSLLSSTDASRRSTLTKPVAGVISSAGFADHSNSPTPVFGGESSAQPCTEAATGSGNLFSAQATDCQGNVHACQLKELLPSLAQTVDLSASPSDAHANLPDSSLREPGRLIYLSPKGKPLTQSLVRELALEKHITLICGRYEGIDSRIEEIYQVERISVGDFVLNGGEAAASCLIEAVARLLPGFMGHEASGDEESFSDSLLEYRQYTRPEQFYGIEVPAVLRSGNHARIDQFRHQERLEATVLLRPDLLERAVLTPQDRHYIKTLSLTKPGKNLYCALVHYPVLDKFKNSVAVSLTNLDIHDICRSSCTYGLGGCFMVTPIEDQQELLTTIVQHWTTGAGGTSNPDRKAALEKVYGVRSIAEAITQIETETGHTPLIYGTTAVVPTTGKKNKEAVPREISLDEARKKLYSHPVLLLFGTGHGLAPEAKDMCHGFLPPIRWHGEYNHLSVRSACAIILDRILGDWL